MDSVNVRPLIGNTPNELIPIKLADHPSDFLSFNFKKRDRIENNNRSFCTKINNSNNNYNK